jgi:gliding motility-associated-like protein
LFATHLVGGNLAYTYLGDTDGDGNFNYLVTFQTFLDCNSPFWLNGFPEPTLDVGIYEGVGIPSGNLPLVMIATLPLIDSSSIIPAPTNGCSVGQSVCLYQATYQIEVDLPNSFQGYHLFYDRCCRTGSVINLNNPGNQGLAFHAYIAPTLVNNSSPVFSDVPVPFLCVNDTVSILNTAVDPDGDVLLFSFADPYQGFGNSGNPAPPLPNPSLPWPIPTVNWLNASYNQNNPFGPAGYAFINGSTGLTQYMAPLVGDYVVAVEIREFRNGNLIGITRRDIQIVVINCPPNPPPNLSPTGGSGITQYTLEECDTLSFPIIFEDPNGDSLTLVTAGQIFDTSFVNPAATIDSLVIGDSTVTANFNWQTSCGTAQALPYLFTVSVTDNGCPPKTTNIVYQVTVEPPPPPDSIIGPLLVCQTSNGIYSVNAFPGYTYTWTVTNGTILSGQGTGSIGVNWPNVGSGTVSVTGISDCGCPSASIDTTVTILSAPFADAGNDTTICLGDSVLIGGSPTGPLGTIFLWTPNININNTTIANPLVWPSTTTSYIVAVDNGICVTNDTVIISVGSANINAGVDTSICLGDFTQLNASGGITYSWSPGGTLSDSTISNPTANPIVTTTYVATITDSLGCTGVDSIIVTVDTFPTIIISGDTSICLGDCAQITVSGGVSYLWSPGGTLSDSTISNPVACPINTTTYYVDVSNSSSCISKDSLVVTINPTPIITTNNDTAVCDGICVQLNTNGGVSYIWTPTTGLSNGTIANPLACPLITTTYVVSGVDANGCSSSDTVTITINPLPIVDAGNDQGICVSGAVVIGGAPTGPSGATYLWSPGATLDDNTLSNPTATPLVTTTYTVTVTDTNGCVDFDVITISINSIPTVNAGNDTTICVGESLVIGGSPTGPTSATFNWTPAGSLNNNTFLNPIATPNVTTEYIVTVTDSNGCIGIDSVLVTANILPIIIVSNDTSICSGDCAQLNATGGTGYVWTPPGTLSNSNIFNPIACPNSNTTYIVTVTDANNCVDTASVSVTINPLPTILAGPDLWLCTGDSIQLNATGGISYLWTPSIGLNDSTIANPMANPLTSTNYIVTGFDVNGCSSNDTILITVNDDVPIAPGTDTTICAGDSVVLGGAPTSPIGTSYIWFPNGGTINDDTLANPTVFPTITTTYYVVATNDTCTAIDSVTITINSAPTINAGVDIDICIGDSIQLNAIGGINYIWQPGGLLTDSTISNPIGFPNDTTEFIVFGTDLNGCSAFDSVIVNVNPLPIISAGAATSICSGDSVQLTASGGVSYLWIPGSSLSDSTISNPIAFPLGSTTYIVTGIDAIGCSNLDSLTVTVNQLNITDLTDTIICIGEALQLTVNGPPGATYLWTPATNLSNTTIFNPITTTQVTITYIVTVTDNNGCIDTTSILVTAEPKPTASFTQETAPTCDGISVEFTNLSIGATSFLWNFGDGDQSDEINPTHVFAYGLPHTVTLTAYSFGLCSDTLSVVINTGNFEDYFNITPPTVLTPNRDGLNDLFKIDLPDGVGNCTDIKVFNRWGMKIYDSYGQNSGWDGRTTTGTKVPEGTYFYIIEVNGIVKKGAVTLID